MNYVRRLIKEDRLNDLKNYIEKYIPEISVNFNVSNNYLNLVVENKKTNSMEVYLITNFSCRRITSNPISTNANVMAIRIENCFFTYMCETYKGYNEAFIQSLKSFEIENCEISPV